MKLTSFRVNGFKNLKDTKIELEGITSLVAFNNYGKSNLFDALQFGLNFISSSNKEKLNMMKLIECIPINKELANENYKFELELAFAEDEEADFSYCQYGYEFKWEKNDKSGARIISEFLKIKPRGEKKKYEQIIKRDENTVQYKRNASGRCSHHISIEKNELVISKLKSFDSLYYLDILNKINEVNFILERHLDASQMYNMTPFKMRDENIFDMDDLPRTLASLNENYKDRYELLKNSFIQLFPNIRDIQIKSHEFKNGKEYEKFLKDAPFVIKDEIHKLLVIDENLNQPIDFRMMSDGVKRMLALLTRIVTSELENCSLVAIEEPENSIHPTLLKAFLTIVNELKGNSQILFASHSPFLVQYLDLKNIYFGMPNNHGIAYFKNIKSVHERNKILKEAISCDMNIGEYCFDLLVDATNDNERFISIFGSDIE